MGHLERKYIYLEAVREMSRVCLAVESLWPEWRQTLGTLQCGEEEDDDDHCGEDEEEDDDDHCEDEDEDDGGDDDHCGEDDDKEEDNADDDKLESLLYNNSVGDLCKIQLFWEESRWRLVSSRTRCPQVGTWGRSEPLRKTRR